MRASRRYRSRRSGRFINHAQIQNVPPQQMLDDLASFQRVLFTNHRVRALSDAVRAGDTRCRIPIRRSTSSRSKARSSSSAPAASVTAVRANRRRRLPVVRFHDIATQCPRPVDTVSPPASPLRRARTRLARNARTYEITLSRPARRSVARAPIRAGRLLTGFVGFGLAAPSDDWNKFDVPGLRGIRNTAPYFHNNSAATLEEVVDHYIEFFKRVKVDCPARCRAAARLHRRRALRSTARARGARGAARLPAKAVAGLGDSR